MSNVYVQVMCGLTLFFFGLTIGIVRDIQLQAELNGYHIQEIIEWIEFSQDCHIPVEGL